MRYLIIGLWLFLAASVAVGVPADEPTAGQPEADESQVTEPDDAESKAVASQAEIEEKADADIRRIETGVSGADDIEEFIPKKPLSADEDIGLWSDT